MNLTTLFRLRKPEGTDPVNIEDFNDNFDVIDAELGKRPEKTGNASDMVAKFTQASARANLSSGEKLATSFGKIMKFFADLKAVAFSGSYNDLANKPSIPSGAAASLGVANNDTTTAAGWVADARIVRQHGLEIDQLSSDISKAIGYIDYTSAADLSDIGTGATVTEDGVVRLIASRYTTGNFEPILYINNAVVWTENMAPYGSCGIQSQYFPVRQGDTVKATFSGCSSGRVEFCRFRN